MENLIIISAFITAVGYLTRLVWLQFQPSNTGCAKGCSSCSGIERAENIE